MGKGCVQGRNWSVMAMGWWDTKGSAICKGKPDEKKKKKEKANQIEDLGDGEVIGRISKEYVRVTETMPKSKTDLQLTVLHQGSPTEQMEVKFLIEKGCIEHCSQRSTGTSYNPR